MSAPSWNIRIQWYGVRSDSVANTDSSAILDRSPIPTVEEYGRFPLEVLYGSCRMRNQSQSCSAGRCCKRLPSSSSATPSIPRSSCQTNQGDSMSRSELICQTRNLPSTDMTTVTIDDFQHRSRGNRVVYRDCRVLPHASWREGSEYMVCASYLVDDSS